MTAIMSPGSSPATSPPAIATPTASAVPPPLPPLITSPPSRRSTLPRPMSHASKNRLSQYSTGSIPSRSRPPSHIFPLFPSSLPYTLVRDFAYPAGHPMYYGPPPEPSRPPSGITTPASEQRRLSDPPITWDSKMSWDWGGDTSGKGGDLAPIQLADGPPWSEDEDLQSPVVSSRHRKHKSSSSGGFGHGRSRSGPGRDIQPGLILDPDNYDRDRGYYVGTSGDGSERYYINQGQEANGPGGEYVTYPPGQARHTASNAYQIPDQQPRQYAEHDAAYDSEDSDIGSSPGYPGQHDESRYSRDYQFTITSPDEEMHGKAVALFDFHRENDSELPLVEGQIIWVSYRHEQGWLVAEDPRTQESGLVPEGYVRLLRDIEGGMNSLTGHLGESPISPNDVGTPTQAEHHHFGHTPTPSNVANGYHQPIVSTFSTSSKDLDRYPQHLLGTQTGHAPPQVVHYHGQRGGGSQANTPTLLFHHDIGPLRRGSQDLPTPPDGGENGKDHGAALETLPDAKLDSPTDSNEEDAKIAGAGR
ncbi:hypothetical protein B0H66DRAFT_468238 [Apodospora peruviana]|uniref:SH3 domain-containing protein n=1 Tax=Apodospora peruviana TaxID=516989 RepID=A0AAE0ISF7_9PEZI|nr:hypothetical protein B0H66DRAFT_468238 [Apodospora peruviana]